MLGRRDTGGVVAGKSGRGCKENRSEAAVVVEGAEAGRTLIVETREWCLYFKPVETGEEGEIGGREERGAKGGRPVA
jgi:hypothetical protein